MADAWPTKALPVTRLLLDEKNPRLGRETTARAPREIIQYLFDHDGALDVATSIAAHGYFPNEPLLAVKDKDNYVIIEGNRRLPALKALKEPGLLEGPFVGRLERLARRNPALDVTTVPVTIAPSRKATDRYIASRHIGTPILRWQAENRASFILDKIQEGYNNEDLREILGFSESDIQEARQTRAIAEMARSLDLPPEVRDKLDNPRAKVFTTLERVFRSSVGREYLRIVPDAKDGLRGTTTRQEFVKGFSKLVTDVVLGKASSRTLNSNEEIRKYFESWKPGERPQKGSGSFIPADIIKGRSTVSSGKPKPPPPPPKKPRTPFATVVPRDFKVRVGNERLIDLRRELGKLKRATYPNASAVLLRVFLELSIVDYLKRTGAYDKLKAKLKAKGALPPTGPTMKHLIGEILPIAKQHLGKSEFDLVAKALRYDVSAPFSISELHQFVHQADVPSERDTYQFWTRTAPLFRLMLEQASDL